MAREAVRTFGLTRDDFSPEYVLGRVARRLVARLEEGEAKRDDAPHLGLITWGQRFLGHYLSLPPSRMHRELAAELDTWRTKRGNRYDLVGPRGTAKSVLGSLVFPLRCAVEGSEPYIQIISESSGQAELLLESVSSEIESNGALARAYPDSTGAGPVWRDDRIVLRNGVMIEALGTGQKIRGRRRRASRPSLIVVDDPQNEDHIYSVTLRQRTMRWFNSAVGKAGNRRTNVLVLGSSLHRECIAEDLTRRPGWHSIRYRSIEAWPKRMDLWARWEATLWNLDNPTRMEDAREFYESNRADMDAGSRVLWPESEDLYDLMMMRARDGIPSFEAEKQSNPSNPDLAEWPESYFGETIWFEQWPKTLRYRTIAVDPSKGKHTRLGDYSAIVKLGLGADNILYIDADLARRSVEGIVDDTLQAWYDFLAEATAFETNDFQEYVADEFTRKAEARGYIVPVTHLTNMVSKPSRIRRLGPYLSQRKFRFRASPGGRLLVQQLRDFPAKDAHDDGPDALEMALRVACELAFGRGSPDGLGDRLPV